MLSQVVIARHRVPTMGTGKCNTDRHGWAHKVLFSHARTVFYKLWSANHWWSAAIRGVVSGGPQAIWEEKKALQKLYQFGSKECTHTCPLKLPLVIDLQQKVGEFLLSTSCPTIIILENYFKYLYRKMWLW
jgi:hypothetical protein